MVGCGRATQVWFSAIIIIYFASVVRSCFIAGYDSGKCAETSEFDDQMTFCGEFVKYRACIPLTNVSNACGNECVWRLSSEYFLATFRACSRFHFCFSYFCARDCTSADRTVSKPHGKRQGRLDTKNVQKNRSKSH